MTFVWKIAAAGLAGCSLVVGAASAEPWRRGYVIEWIEQAAHFGGKGLLTEPGTDCPKGTEPEMDLTKSLVTPYRTPEQVKTVLDLEITEKPENLFQAMTKRGLNGENIYKELKAAPDPGMFEMEGKIAEGFDLDGDKRTGFTSPAGAKGIDNNFYTAWGCWEAFRGPPRLSAGALYHNDEMLNGKFTVLFLLSGNKSPQNDDDVTFGIYTSKDKLVKDAKGGVASDYSFRIANDKAYTSILKAKITKGVLELTEPQDIRTREASFLASLTLYDGHARFNLKPDGTIEGMLGGYKPIQEAITTWTIAGPNVELVTHVNLSAAYYAIERHADARPDPKTGQNTAISTAVRFWGVPAFMVNTEGSALAEVAQIATTSPPTP